MSVMVISNDENIIRMLWNFVEDRENLSTNDLIGMTELIFQMDFFYL